jgi:hypothetical protein
MKRHIATDDMIAFMVSLPPDENITQAVIRGAMERFGVRESAANQAYGAATASGRIRQMTEQRMAPAYQGTALGYFHVNTGYYYWKLVSDEAL